MSTETELEGRIAIVTGASRGIGEATARRLARSGACVALGARSADALEELAKELSPDGERAMGVPVDLTAPADLDRLIGAVQERWGRVDILVNNAGVFPVAKRAERVSLDEWNRMIAINLTAPWYLACRARELMPDGGSIVNVSSTAAFYATTGLGPYNVTKAGVEMLTRSLAVEWARSGIRVNTVVPGKIDTDMLKPIVEYITARNIPPNPLNRLGDPHEVAEAIAYLVSDRASFITGATLVIDGGELLTAAR